MRLGSIALRLLITLLIAIAVVGGFLFVGSAPETTKFAWGVNFSHTQAVSLGLDWKETYKALLDDLSVRRFRIPVYWDELEPQRGQFDFSSWDWQLQELASRQGTAIVAVGRKLPRWPECREPTWFTGLAAEEQNEAQLMMVRTVVEHYRDNPIITAWQIENEPFLHFGICPKPYPIDMLDREIALVKELDPSRPIVITDTGEFSTWLQTGKRADILGSTIYRIIHDPLVGFIRYPIPPVWYHRKTVWIRWWHPRLRVIFTEAQAEPWVVMPPITRYSIEEQYQTMGPDRFHDQIQYLKRTGIDEIYLWGAEWWYWLTTQNERAIWDEARTLFAES